ncbi:MAG: hypothetical protein A2Y10_20560 [Planctomycetes bacterium GWF2_41_51]|nr:MAG: hypothetical protein A2Y10_20560 [Planctomycetes bacterium GWF2_41_51]HBG25693.1 hypothetical protein [Phycisphaerales bacterium]
MAEMKQRLISLVLGKVSKELTGEVFTPAIIKSSPFYYKSAVPKQVIVGQENFEIGGKSVTFHLRGYQPDVLLVQTTIEVENLFQKNIFALEKQAYEHSYRILKDYGADLLFSEDYSVFAVTNYQGEPEQFLNNRDIIASLLKSEESLTLDPQEVEYTLASRIKYGNNDLSIIDWDGVFLFDPVGDIEEDLELLTLANLQLLRHRILDHRLDTRLARMAELVHKMPAGRMYNTKELAEKMKETMEIRMGSISELQRLERDMKLIGDWYSARFYELAASKFKIDEWKKTIRGKLESLEDAYSVVIENFTVSTKHRAEWIQIIAFFILQIGWLALIILELMQITSH